VFAKIQRIHFVGIGGIGMSGIAEVLLTLGYKVSGSDLKPSPTTDRLKQLGAIVFIGHAAENVAGAEVVVTSSAISPENPEADESDRSFLKLSPIIAVVTNIDREHMDTYHDMDDVEQTFIDFLDRLPFYGMAVVCNDDERVRNLLPRIGRRAVTYGSREGSDFRIRNAQAAGLQHGENSTARPISRFSVDYHAKSLGEFQVIVPGAHNVQNAAAAVAVGIGLDISPENIRRALAEFNGVDRRFE